MYSSVAIGCEFVELIKKFNSEKSAVSHSITWRNAVAVRQGEVSGATAFAISGQFSTLEWNCVVSGRIFPAA